MNDKSEEPTSKQQEKGRLAKLRDRKRQHADEQLDDALKQTFPASDALSIVQSARGD